MKLLIVTQKVDIDDDVLGFMHSWIIEFAKRCKQITVICLQKGKYDLPENVKVLSLGKEKLLSRYGGTKLLYCWKFYKYIWQERQNYTHIFVHMNPEYIVLGGLLWKLWGKKIGLWYAHGKVPFSLRIASKLSHIIFTSTKSGCRLNNKKIKVIGQGIDTNKFQISNNKKQTNLKSQISNSKFKIVTVGRISPSKDYQTLIKAVEILVKHAESLWVKIIGGAGLEEQEKYLIELQKMVREKKLNKVIEFIGPVPNKDIVKYLQSADLFVNMGQTGSLDKAMVEAMASGLPLLTCNEAMLEVFGDYKEKLMYNKGDYQQLAEKIKMIIDMSLEQRQKIGSDLREIIIKNHSLENFVKRILSILN